MPQPIERLNDFVIKFANVNGSGSASANTLFAKSILRMGVPVTPRNIFPSNIQGLPTWYEIRASKDGYLARGDAVDLMVAMNVETYARDVREVAPEVLRHRLILTYEADAEGVSMLEKLGVRADGVSSFFEQMMEHQPKDMAAAAGIWSSHPPTGERIAATKRPASGKPAFTAAEWKAIRDVCK